MSEVIPAAARRRASAPEYKYLAEQLGFDAGDFLPPSGSRRRPRPACSASSPPTASPRRLRGARALHDAAPEALVRGRLAGPRATAHRRHRLVPVILGGPADAEAAARIAAADPRIVNLAGQTRLPRPSRRSPIRRCSSASIPASPHGHRAGAADGGDLRLHLPLSKHRPAHRQRDLAGPRMLAPAGAAPPAGAGSCLRDITPAMVLDAGPGHAGGREGA